MNSNRYLLMLLSMTCALIIHAYSIHKTEYLPKPIVSESVWYDIEENPLNQNDLMMNGKTFEVINPDTKLSPYTGMTRDHWKQAAEFLLNTAFQYVNDIK